MSESASSRPTKIKRYTVWAIQAVLAVAFLGAGGSKIAGVESMVEMYDQIGIGQWFRYLTALCEVGGAVLLWVPGAAVVGAWLLASTMVGAVIAHLFVIGGSPVPAAGLFVLAAAILWLRRDQIAGLRQRLAI